MNHRSLRFLLPALLIAIQADHLAAQVNDLNRLLPADKPSQVLESEPATAAEPTEAEQHPPGADWVLIVCGHPGDEEHRTLFASTIETLHDGLITSGGFEPEKIIVQFGGKFTSDDGPALAGAQGEATGAELRQQVDELAKLIGEHDRLWTIVMGHAHYNGRHSFLNLPGADVHQDDFASWFTGIKGDQVFLITTPVSGFFIRPLSGENRIVITATQADLEVNETLYPLALAEVLSDPPPMSQFDADGDQKITLFDLYQAVARNVADRYLAEDLLATEHALLEGNGDGVGTELQLDYLTVEQGGRAREEVSPPKIRPNSDGAAAVALELSRLKLPKEVEQPADEEPAAEESEPEEMPTEEEASEK